MLIKRLTETAIVATLCALLLPSTAFATATPRGWTKAILRERPTPALDAQAHGKQPTDEDVVAIGAGRIRDYGSFIVVRLPQAALEHANEQALSRGLELEVRDEWNRIIMPRGTIDARKVELPAGDLFDDDESQQGLYVIQFESPEVPEWHTLIEKLGLKYVQYIPHNAVIVAGDKRAYLELARQPFVEFSSPYHPAFRGFGVVSSGRNRYTIQLINIDEAQPLLAQLKAASTEETRIAEYGPYVNIDVTLDAGELAQLHRHPWVMTIEERGVWVDSGERESIANTGSGIETLPYPSAPTAAGGIRLPWITQWYPIPGTIRSRPRKSSTVSSSNDYQAWLNANGVLNHNNINQKLAIADQGLYKGHNLAMHADLCGGSTQPGCTARVTWDTVPKSNGQTDPGDDASGHGTLVTGMATAEPTTSQALEPAPGDDLSQRFYLSTGVAPRAQMLIQKIFQSSAQLANRSMLEWMRSAWNNNAVAQVQARNELTESYTPGTYSLLDQQYDAAVREVNLPVTISTGNKYSSEQLFPNGMTTAVVTPALAKNVITVGGTESVRAAGPAGCAAVDPQWMIGESLSNIAYLSRRGTTALDGRIKPEVVAPATFVSSTRFTQYSAIHCTTGFGSTFDSLYAVSSGTSFASPQVGASILLLDTKFGTTTRFSAALAKAAIVATATSMRGGKDKQTGMTIGSIPDTTTGQGFGRLDLSKLVGNAWVRTARDESSWTAFTAAGQTQTNYFSIANLGKPTVIALAWTDPEPSATSPGPALVRDLNLEVSPASCCGGGWYRGNKISTTDYSIASPGSYDSKNNVEVIVLPPGVGFTSFLVTISATTLPGAPWTPTHLAGSTQQRFAVFLLNAQ